MALDLTTLLTSGSGSIIGFVVGVVQQRSSREAQFQKRIDKELGELRAKVAECERERQHVLIIRMGFRMNVPELQRLSPRNPVLKQLAGALSALPPDDATFADLIAQLNEIPYEKQQPEERK